MKINRLTLAALLCIGILPGAWGKNNEADVNFRGTLIEPPPCVINEGGAVDVDFGERVGVNKVDGNNYRQPIDYRISCDPNAGRWSLLLTLRGTATAFDRAAVQTGKADLGIRVYQDDKPFTLGEMLTIDASAPPRLEAVPVKRPGATLTEGGFEATATLLAIYQ